MEKLGKYVNIRTGKLNANKSSKDGEFPFFTCAIEPLRIDHYAFDCECVLVAGNGDLNVKYYNGKFNAYQRTYIIESNNKNVLSTKFLRIFLDRSLERLRSNTKGGIIQYIRLNDLTDLKIILPSIINQKRIVKVLSDAEQLISQRKESIALLDELLKSTFLDMFGDPVSNEKGWDIDIIKNHIGKVITGNTPPRNNPKNYSPKHIEWIKTNNIKEDKTYITEASEYLSEQGLKRARTINKGALLVACIAGSIDSIGRVALTNKTVSFNQQINAIEPNKDVSSLFLFWLFKISKFYIQSHATKGMKKILTKGIFEKIRLIKPPINLQNKFAKIVEKTEDIKKDYQESLQELENLYGSLSQRAFKGELDLSGLEIEEEFETLNMAAESKVEYGL